MNTPPGHSSVRRGHQNCKDRKVCKLRSVLHLAQADDVRHRQRKADRAGFGARAGGLVDGGHDGCLLAGGGHDVKDVLFLGQRHAEELFRLFGAGAAGVQHRAAPRAGGAGRVHDGVGIARVQHRDDELVLELQVGRAACGGLVSGQICQGPTSCYALDGHGQHDAVARYVHIKFALGRADQLAGALGGGHRRDDGLLGVGQPVDGKLLAGGGALAQHDQAHVQLKALEQPGQLLDLVAVGDADDVIQFHSGHLLPQLDDLVVGVGRQRRGRGRRHRAAQLDDVDGAHDLDGDQGHHGHQGHQAEGVGHDAAAQRVARAHGKGQHKGGGHGARSHAARVERDGGEDGGHHEGEGQGDQVARHHKVEDGQAGQHADHGQAVGGGHRDAQAQAHGLGRDGAAGQVLHLLVQHMDGGLGVDDEPAHQHRQGDQQKAHALADHLAAQHIAQRGKAHVHAGQKQHQAHIGVQDAHRDAGQLGRGQPQGGQLEQQKEHEDGGQRRQHLQHIFGDGLDVAPADVGGLRELLHRDGGGAGAVRVDKAQQQHGQDGPHRTQRHQAEAVVLGLFVAADGGDAHAQRHDKGHGHGPGGDAARVKGHRQERRVGQKRQDEHHGIEGQQQPPQRDAQQDAHHAHH